MRGIWNRSVLDSLNIGDWTVELAEKTDTRIPTMRKSYDGQYYYAMAFDPFLISRDYIRYLDVPLYRYRRMLYPLLASIFVLGNHKSLAYSLFFVNVIAWFLLGWVTLKIARFEKFPRFYLVLGTCLASGVTFSTFRTLPETLALMLVLWGCLFWKEKNWYVSILFFALSGWARENALIVPMSIFVYEFVHHRFPLAKLTGFSAAVVMPTILWWFYLHFRLPPGDIFQSDFLTIPFMGMYRIDERSEKIKERNRQARNRVTTR